MDTLLIKTLPMVPSELNSKYRADPGFFLGGGATLELPF